MMIGISSETLGAAKRYVDESLLGGGAVVTSFTATPSSANSYDDNYLTITVTGSTGNWQNNLFAMVVVTG